MPELGVTLSEVLRGTEKSAERSSKKSAERPVEVG